MIHTLDNASEKSSTKQAIVIDTATIELLARSIFSLKDEPGGGERSDPQ